MKINAKEIKKISKIKNSFYDDLKIEFLFHAIILEIKIQFLKWKENT